MLYNVIKEFAVELERRFGSLSAEVNHGGVKGDLREHQVREFLRSVLPNPFRVETGIIVDSEAQQSRQQDVIIIDSNAVPPFFDDGQTKVVPVESVIATVEIKSRFDNRTSEEIARNISSIRDLKPRYISKDATKVGIPATFVFAYNVLTPIPQVESSIMSNTGLRPNLVVILNKGCLLHFRKSNLTHISVWPGKSTSVGFCESEEASVNLMMFYLVLMSLIYEHSHAKRFPDLVAYAIGSGFVSPPTRFEPNQVKGAAIDLDEQRFVFDELVKLQKEYFSVALPQATEKGIPATAFLRVLRQWEKAMPGFFDRNKLELLRQLESLPIERLENMYVPLRTDDQGDTNEGITTQPN